MPCNSQAVVRATVNVSLVAAMLNDTASVDVLVARILKLLGAPGSFISRSVTRIDVELTLDGYRKATLTVLSTGAVSLNSRDTNRSRLDGMLPTINLEIRKLGALAAQSALIKGATEAALAKGGRVIQNAPTANAGRQLVLALA